MGKNHPFLPIIIGTDTNAYGMARAFYEEYGIKPLLLGQKGANRGIKRLILGEISAIATQNSRIVNFQKVDLDSKSFVSVLENIAEQFPDKKLILLVCGEEYAKLVIENKKTLQKHFIIPYTDKQQMDNLLLKEDFYKLCDKYNFKYPKTAIVTYSNFEITNFDFNYPIIIKASNSIDYSLCKFTGKKKVFIANDEKEKVEILRAIYGSSYRDNIIIQEYIPGDDSYLRVVHVYVGKDRKVKLMYLGKPLLADPTPSSIGNYTALIPTFDEQLLENLRFLLEDIGYTGYANFDLKQDPRDKEYKLLEINIRNGASNYSVTSSGHNFMKYVVDDYIYDIDRKLTYVKEECLWKIIPDGVLFKYVKNEELKTEAKKLIGEGKNISNLYYHKDMNMRRWVKLKLFDYYYYYKYWKYSN
ncbi:ATP-grasp domain-containing protein [Lysinibacillus sp. BW-2-10]|uniref:carboxylate--amine ligase n=1 Tax=Lysinibacillus sp. BW-2-10 TaxID=2590030 RepID=UPI0011814153|nr:ATP-grasp domain-containing protein [Lysinibacillus sp. BW-2-10]TSI11333.1 ATP-grasp domain-containing protein [Lysinibacillus sp. BW-2-10]